MLARVNLPRRKRDSKPAFGTYVLTYTDGSTQTVRSDVLQLADYPDVNKAIALNGGTIVQGTRSASLGGTGGDYGLSITGGNYSHYCPQGGNVSINHTTTSSSVYYTLQPDGCYYGDNYYDGKNTRVDLMSVPDYSKVGELVMVNRNIGNFHSTLGYFYTIDMTKATSVTLTSRTGDYGVCGTSPTSTLASGAEYYASVKAIVAYYSDSTVHGTDASNNIYLYGGGDRQIVFGGLNNDTIDVYAGSCMFPDYGIGVTRCGANFYLANNTSQTLTGTTHDYNRYDASAYRPGSDTIQIHGTVTGIYLYCPSTNLTNRKQNSFTAAVTYVHNSGSDEVIVLRDVMKEPTTTSGTDSKQVFWTNTVAVPKIKIYQIDANGNSASVSSDALKAMMHEDTAIPLWAARKVAGLNEAFFSLTPPHTNVHVTGRTSYNISNAPFNTITPATVDEWWYANYADDSGEGGDDNGS